MGTLNLSKFSSQANPEVLNSLHQIADAEGRKFHSVLDEAFRDYLNKKGISMNSRKAMTHFAQSLGEFEELYKKLAK
jgi:predicted transcriptional regulator